jgi:hypothetical protein
VAALTVCKCACGIKFKVLSDGGRETQAHACTCGHQIKFPGAIRVVFVAEATHGVPIIDNWRRVLDLRKPHSLQF